MLIIEATIGIKSGIPENLIIEFNLFDTDGIATNTYSLDISDEIPPQDEEDEEDITDSVSKGSDGSNSSGDSSNANSNSDADVDDWPYELAEKVSKTKATKNAKSTKSKSSKTKSTKTKAASKSKSSKDTNSEDDYSDEDAAEIIEANSVDNVKLVNDKKILLTIGAAAIAVCLIGGCAAGIINRNRKNGRGEK